MTHLFTYLWVAWIVLFPIIEAAALHQDKRTPTGDVNHNGVHDDGFTLSAHVRKWVRVDTAPGRTAFLVATAAFAVSFIVHIVSGKWFG